MNQNSTASDEIRDKWDTDRINRALRDAKPSNNFNPGPSLFEKHAVSGDGVNQAGGRVAVKKKLVIPVTPKVQSSGTSGVPVSGYINIGGTLYEGSILFAAEPTPVT